MENEKKNNLPKQVCSIRIVFPVESDEQAIRYKKGISDVLADIPNAFISFSLSTSPPNRDPRLSSPLTPNTGLI